MEKFRCDGTMLKMPGSFQLLAPKDIIQRRNIQKQKD